jgi:transcription elongation factor Elf1
MSKAKRKPKKKHKKKQSDYELLTCSICGAQIYAGVMNEKTDKIYCMGCDNKKVKK